MSGFKEQYLAELTALEERLREESEKVSSAEAEHLYKRATGLRLDFLALWEGRGGFTDPELSKRLNSVVHATEELLTSGCQSPSYSGG